MTLRARLGWGLFSIALVLTVPLVFSLSALERLYETSRLLRDREFAASMLLGSFRERTDDARRAEDALLFILDTLRAAARDEYEQASAGRSSVAELISQQRTRRAIASVDSALGASATTLRNRTRQRFADATSETLRAERLVAGALPIALLIALVIGIWLLRSISRPVHELDRGMRAIAEGDLTHELGLSPTQGGEFGRLAASYRAMARQLGELERLRAEFVSVASHELKTPINVVIGYLELLQEGIYGELSPKQKEILLTINKQAQTLTRLVKRLLDISRFEASGGKIEVRRVDHGPGLPEKVFWDEDRINEVLGNLISNAFKFTPRGGKVALTVAAVDDNVVVTVSDTGAGISAEQLPHIFDKFYQADNQAAAATKGTGLGLAIAREIVEAHGGQITVESRVGEGTTFVVTLPTESSTVRRRVEPATNSEEAR